MSPAPRQARAPGGWGRSAKTSRRRPWLALLADPGGDLPGLKGEFQLLAGLLRRDVVLDLVHQLSVESFDASADRTLTSPVDQRHQRADVPRGAGEQVVRQLLGEHAR